jgi:hypothetical protein
MMLLHFPSEANSLLHELAQPVPIPLRERFFKLVKASLSADEILIPSKIVQACARSALRGAEAIETLFLLVAERAVKLLERGLHGLHRAQHCIEPLLHRLQADNRGERSIRGALRAQQIGRLGRGIL